MPLCVCVIWVKNDTWDFNWSWKAGLRGLREEDGGGLCKKDSLALGLESREFICF